MADFQGVWWVSPTGSVVRIDPSTNEIVAEIEVTASPCGGSPCNRTPSGSRAATTITTSSTSTAPMSSSRTSMSVASTACQCWLMAIPVPGGNRLARIDPQRTASTRSWRSTDPTSSRRFGRRSGLIPSGSRAATVEWRESGRCPPESLSVTLALGPPHFMRNRHAWLRAPNRRFKTIDAASTRFTSH